MTARCSLSTERQHWQNQESDIPSIPARHEFRIVQVHPWVYPCDGPIACGCESHLYLSIYLPACLLAYLPIHLPTYLPTLSINLYLSIYLAVCLSVYIYLSISLSLSPSIVIPKVQHRLSPSTAYSSLGRALQHGTEELEKHLSSDRLGHKCGCWDTISCPKMEQCTLSGIKYSNSLGTAAVNYNSFSLSLYRLINRLFHIIWGEGPTTPQKVSAPTAVSCCTHISILHVGHDHFSQILQKYIDILPRFLLTILSLVQRQLRTQPIGPFHDWPTCHSMPGYAGASSPELAELDGDLQKHQLSLISYN
jgi:hypothetical protein